MKDEENGAEGVCLAPETSISDAALPENEEHPAVKKNEDISITVNAKSKAKARIGGIFERRERGRKIYEKAAAVNSLCSEDTGKTNVEGEARGNYCHPGDDGAGAVSNINNILMGHSFRNLNCWSKMGRNSGDIDISDYPHELWTKFGKSLLRMQSYSVDCIDSGVYQQTKTLPVGQYTFSAYLRVLSNCIGSENPGAYIRVTAADGTVLAESEHIAKYSAKYIRLIAPFALTFAQRVQVQVLLNGKSIVYADAVQLERNPYANAYNMLENGSFECGSDGWETSTSGVASTSHTRFDLRRSLMVTGDPEEDRYAYQTVYVKSNYSTRETFTLSGWAKGSGQPTYRNDGGLVPTFRLRAVIQYHDSYYREYGEEEYTADFSPCTEGWQFASVQFAKNKYRTVEYVRVYCDYGGNTGTVYFDDIQLVRNSIETYLSASDFASLCDGKTDK